MLSLEGKFYKNSFVSTIDIILNMYIVFNILN